MKNQLLLFAFFPAVVFSSIRGHVGDYYFKSHPYVDVMSYNARGDGVTNDYVAISSAFTKAIASQSSVYFPSGTYRITKTTSPVFSFATAAQKITILGDGIGKTIIKLDTTNADFVFFNFSGSNQSITIKDVSFYVQDTLSVVSSKYITALFFGPHDGNRGNIVLDNVEIRGGRPGIKVDNSYGYFELRNSRVHHCVSVGVQINSRDGSGADKKSVVIIDNNDLYACENNGLSGASGYRGYWMYFDPAGHDISIRNNRFGWPADTSEARGDYGQEQYYGLHFYPGSVSESLKPSMTIDNNIFGPSAKTSIVDYYGGDPVISNNSFIDIPLHAISLGFQVSNRKYLRLENNNFSSVNTVLKDGGTGDSLSLTVLSRSNNYTNSTFQSKTNFGGSEKQYVFDGDRILVTDSSFVGENGFFFQLGVSTYDSGYEDDVTFRNCLFSSTDTINKFINFVYGNLFLDGCIFDGDALNIINIKTTVSTNRDLKFTSNGCRYYNNSGNIFCIGPPYGRRWLFRGKNNYFKKNDGFSTSETSTKIDSFATNYLSLYHDSIMSNIEPIHNFYADTITTLGLDGKTLLLSPNYDTYVIGGGACTPTNSDLNIKIAGNNASYQGLFGGTINILLSDTLLCDNGGNVKLDTLGMLGTYEFSPTNYSTIRVKWIDVLEKWVQQ